MNPFVLLLRRMQKKNARERIEVHRNDFDLRAERDIPYLEDEDSCHRLDLWLPREREGKIPVILEVHGGAYCSCFKEFNNLHAQYLCREGFAVANMNYILHPEADMRQEVREIFAARAWIQEKAPLYGFDTERVFLTGDSAGGHLVLLAGGALSRHKTRDFVGLREPPLPFQKIAATCPMGELGNLDKKTERLLKLLLGKICRDKAYTSQVNFRTFIGEGYPPSFFSPAPRMSSSTSIRSPSMRTWRKGGSPMFTGSTRPRKIPSAMSST